MNTEQLNSIPKIPNNVKIKVPIFKGVSQFAFDGQLIKHLPTCAIFLKVAILFSIIIITKRQVNHSKVYIKG